MNNLGSSLAAAGRWSDAEAALTESLALSHRLLGPRHPDLDNTVRNLAWILEFQGRFAESRALLWQIVADREATDPRGAVLTAAQLAGLRLGCSSSTAQSELKNAEFCWKLVCCL